MHSLFEVGIANALVAAVLADAVWGITRLVQRPALTHALWILVLLKLVTPPILELPIGLRLERIAARRTSTVARRSLPGEVGRRRHPFERQIGPLQDRESVTSPLRLRFVTQSGRTQRKTWLRIGRPRPFSPPLGVFIEKKPVVRQDRMCFSSWRSAGGLWERCAGLRCRRSASFVSGFPCGLPSWHLRESSVRLENWPA